MFNEAAALSYEPFFGDDTDVRVLDDKFVTARKSTRCQVCWGQIEPGQRVRARTERNNEERKVMTFRFCPECCEAMAQADDDSGDAIEKRYSMGMDRAEQWREAALQAPAGEGGADALDRSRAHRSLIRMPIPVDLQRDGKKWLASMPGWSMPILLAEGETQEQAIDQLRWQLSKHFAHTEGEI